VTWRAAAASTAVLTELDSGLVVRSLLASMASTSVFLLAAAAATAAGAADSLVFL
jgi:hypothetical protein